MPQTDQSHGSVLNLSLLAPEIILNEVVGVQGLNLIVKYRILSITYICQCFIIYLCLNISVEIFVSDLVKLFYLFCQINVELQAVNLQGLVCLKFEHVPARFNRIGCQSLTVERLFAYWY